MKFIRHSQHSCWCSDLKSSMPLPSYQAHALSAMSLTLADRARTCNKPAEHRPLQMLSWITMGRLQLIWHAATSLTNETCALLITNMSGWLTLDAFENPTGTTAMQTLPHANTAPCKQVTAAAQASNGSCGLSCKLTTFVQRLVHQQLLHSNHCPGTHLSACSAS
jgi:hypothetical protein